jgi:hypothetical protein
LARNWILYCAVTMSLGWGLRGYIGGGPLGAMIPGALVALALCLLLDRDGDDAAVIAAFGAVGIGFGGQETYGQTIGLAFDPFTRAWGLTGLAVKGAVWGLLGGAVLALGLVRRRFTIVQVAIGLLAMGLMTHAGWKLINEPKLIYFSNALDKPRLELWAGLVLGALALLGWCNDRLMWSFAGRGALFGGIGFSVGGAIQVIGRAVHPSPWIDYWKVMELLLGGLLGAAFGWTAWRWRLDLARRPKPPSSSSMALHLIIAGGIVAGALLVELAPARASYTLAGALLLLLAAWQPITAWHTAITLTYTAFALDYYENSSPGISRQALLAVVGVSAVGMAGVIACKPSARFLYLLLLWTATGASLLKSFVPWQAGVSSHLIPMELLFVLMAAACTWLTPPAIVRNYFALRSN